MAIISKPILVRDVTALSSSSRPVSLETTKASREDDVLGYGWLAGTTIQPGLTAFVARYDSHEAYAISSTDGPCLVASLYLGDGYRSTIGGKENLVPSRYYSLMSFDEPTAEKLYRGEGKLQERCEIRLWPNWTNSEAVERWDDTGQLSAALIQTRLRKSAVASSRMIAAASGLFAAASWEGSLAGLRREAATLTFLAEALAATDLVQPRYPGATITRKMMRVKEMLDNLPPTIEVRLSDLAAEHEMSVSSLCRNFKLTFNLTVLAYVAAQRMDKARVALQRDELTVDQAAYIAGFAHASNFSSAFRQRFGYSPSQASLNRRRQR